MAICVAALAFVSSLRADDSSGLELQGTEALHALVVLSATTNAPANATGLIMIQAEDQGGTVTAQLNVQVQNLIAGPYSISITKKSDTNTAVTLGTFNVDSTNAEVQLSNQSDTNANTQTVIALPAGFDPLDVATITIANADGSAVLIGDLLDGSSVMSGLFKAKVAVVGGAGAPDATGLAYAKSTTDNGVRTTRFKLFAKGTIPNATLTLKINGVDYGTVNTDDNGNLKLQSLPKGVDAESILWIEFDGPDGSNALSVSF
jgi:hypothetical protein